MLGPCEDANEAPEHQLEAALRILWWKFRDRRLLAEDQRQFGDQVDDELSVRAQRLLKGLAPTAQLGVALAEKRPDQALEGLGQGRIGDVTLILVELARGKKAAGRNKHLVELIDDGGLADPRISRNKHQLGHAAGHDAVEAGQQGIDLSRSPVQFLGN